MNLHEIKEQVPEWLEALAIKWYEFHRNRYNLRWNSTTGLLQYGYRPDAVWMLFPEYDRETWTKDGQRAYGDTIHSRFADLPEDFIVYVQ